jgi:hypothetical protein
MRRWALTVLVTVLVVGVGARPAHAEPTAVERETARSLLFAGREKRKEGRLVEALADFEKAHAIMHVPTTARDLGRVQEDLGMLVEARATFLEAVRLPEQPDEPEAFRHARVEAKGRAEAIVPRLATLTIAVGEGVRLRMDGAELSATSRGVPFKVNPGRHELVASGKDGEKRVTVELREGGSEAVALVLGGTGAPRAAASTPPPPESTPPPGATRASPLVWVGLGVLGVGAAVGATTGILAFRAKDDIASRCEGGTRCPPSAYDDVAHGETLGTISTVAFVVAGAGAAVFVYGLLNPTRVSPSTATFRLRPGPGGVAGTF